MDARIQRHLRHVTRRLRARPSDHLARHQLLAALSDYAERGVFPRWDDVAPSDRRARRTKPGFGDRPRAPRWQDGRGTYCAVGQLMALSDARLARQVGAAFGPAWLDEMDHRHLGGWAKAHGFTLAELAWIQPGYFCADVPECADVELPAVNQSRIDQSCALPDPAVSRGYDPYDDYGINDRGIDSVVAFCETCGESFTIWVDVQNLGLEPANDVLVYLRAPEFGYDGGDIIDIDVVQVDLPVLTVTRVELTADSVLDVGSGGTIELEAADGVECRSDNNVYVFGRGLNYGVGYVPPASCGEDFCGRSDPGETAGLSAVCGGCGTGGLAEGWVALGALGFLRRRRSTAI
ncbi:MAG: hypothetical protein AAF211_19675 [Myxococcota bacterium]